MLNAILVALGIREKKMNKFWIVYSAKSKKNDDCCLDWYGCGSGAYTSKPFSTLALAEDHAKQQTAMNLGRTYVILEAMTATIPPVPTVEMTTLTAAAPVVAA
jgi:hypothetical protein